MTAGPPGGALLLGTVAIEPNRWSTVDPSGEPLADLATLADRIAELDVDGLEVWERHLPADVDAAGALAESLPPMQILNSYIGFDTDDADASRAVAARVRGSGATAVKFNVGNDPASEAVYIERVAALAELLPSDVVLLCECHEHISIAETPGVAARMLDAIGPPERVGAIVHTHESADHLRARFDAYGDRIRHVHVNFLDHSTMTVPKLGDRRAEMEQKVALLRELGFEGSWTLEFVEGVLTDRDEPGLLIDQAAVDLRLLREVLAPGAAAG